MGCGRITSRVRAAAASARSASSPAALRRTLRHRADQGQFTNLYNQRPAWLDHAHRRLDEAVFAAYGWPTDLTDDEILAKLLELILAEGAETHLPRGS